MQLNDNEQVKFEQKANLKRGLESVGGKLKVTNERLYFKPHGLNAQKKELELLNHEISEVTETKSLGVIPNGLLVEMKNGDNFKFVVGKRKEIKVYLDSFK